MRPCYLVGPVLGLIAWSAPVPGASEVPLGLHDSVAIAGHTLYLPAGFTVNVFAQLWRRTARCS